MNLKILFEEKTKDLPFFYEEYGPDFINWYMHEGPMTQNLASKLEEITGICKNIWLPHPFITFPVFPRYRTWNITTEDGTNYIIDDETGNLLI